MLTVDFHGLLGVEDAAVGLDTVSFGRSGLDFEGDTFGRRIPDGQRDAHVVVEWSAKFELVGWVEHEPA